jgi:hypothetical protein
MNLPVSTEILIFNNELVSFFAKPGRKEAKVYADKIVMTMAS